MATNTIASVADPSSVAGVANADIASVCGVTFTQAGGCTRGATIVSEDFETGYTDGEEWSQHNWLERNATTDIFVADDAQKYAGTYSGLAVAVGSDANRAIYRTFTALSSGYASFEVYLRISDVAASNGGGR